MAIALTPGLLFSEPSHAPKSETKLQRERLEAPPGGGREAKNRSVQLDSAFLISHKEERDKIRDGFGNAKNPAMAKHRWNKSQEKYKDEIKQVVAEAEKRRRAAYHFRNELSNELSFEEKMALSRREEPPGGGFSLYNTLNGTYGKVLDQKFKGDDKFRLALNSLRTPKGENFDSNLKYVYNALTREGLPAKFMLLTGGVVEDGDNINKVRRFFEDIDEREAKGEKVNVFR